MEWTLCWWQGRWRKRGVLPRWKRLILAGFDASPDLRSDYKLCELLQMTKRHMRGEGNCEEEKTNQPSTKDEIITTNFLKQKHILSWITTQTYSYVDDRLTVHPDGKHSILENHSDLVQQLLFKRRTVKLLEMSRETEDKTAEARCLSSTNQKATSWKSSSALKMQKRENYKLRSQENDLKMVGQIMQKSIFPSPKSPSHQMTAAPQTPDSVRRLDGMVWGSTVKTSQS